MMHLKKNEKIIKEESNGKLIEFKGVMLVFLEAYNYNYLIVFINSESEEHGQFFIECLTIIMTSIESINFNQLQLKL